MILVVLILILIGQQLSSQLAGEIKSLVTKVSVDLHDKFNSLAEYLFERGLSESFTPSALLRDVIEHLLGEYHEGLAAMKIRSR